MLSIFPFQIFLNLQKTSSVLTEGEKKKKQNVIKIKMLHCYVNKLFLKHSTQKKKKEKNSSYIKGGLDWTTGRISSQEG